MTVYIDEIRQHLNVKGEARRYGTGWCHLWADDLEELHEFAAKIGMQRRWFQDERLPHYDMVPSRRRRAILAGAVEMSLREWIRAGRDG